jgi:hypothetical protein
MTPQPGRRPATVWNMILVGIAWGYVVVLMAVAEATNSNGSLLGAFFTLVLYGALPMSIVMYLINTPRRRAAARARRDGNDAASSSANPDGRDHATGDAIAPERKEP